MARAGTPRRVTHVYTIPRKGGTTSPQSTNRPHTFWRTTKAGRYIPTHSQLGTPVGVIPTTVVGSSLLRRIIKVLRQIRVKRPLPRTKAQLGKVIGRHATTKPPVRKIVTLLQRRVRRAQPKTRAFFIKQYGGIIPHNELRYPLVKKERKFLTGPAIWLFPRRFFPPPPPPPPVQHPPNDILYKPVRTRRQPKTIRPRFLQISGADTHQTITSRPLPYAPTVRLVRRRRQPRTIAILRGVVRSFSPVARKHVTPILVKLAPKRRFLKGAVKFIRTIGRRVTIKPPLFPITVKLVKRRQQPPIHTKLYPLIFKYIPRLTNLYQRTIDIHLAPQRRFQRGRIQMVVPKTTNKTKKPKTKPPKVQLLVLSKRRLPQTRGRVGGVVRTFGIQAGGGPGVWRPTFRPRKR